MFPFVHPANLKHDRCSKSDSLNTRWQHYQTPAPYETFQTFRETPDGVCHRRPRPASFSCTSGERGAFQMTDGSTEEVWVGLMSKRFGWFGWIRVSRNSSELPTNRGLVRYGHVHTVWQGYTQSQWQEANWRFIARLQWKNLDAWCRHSTSTLVSNRIDLPGKRYIDCTYSGDCKCTLSK